MVLLVGANNVQSGIDRSPSSVSISKNHSATVLGDLNGDHPKVCGFRVRRLFSM